MFQYSVAVFVKQILPRLFRPWSAAVLPLLILAVQCNTAMPPLPTTPAAPTLPVAILSPAAGELTPFGRFMRNGIILAFDEWNAQGGVNGRRLVWENYQTDCTFNTAQQATRQALADGYEFILGPICSEAAIAAAVEAQTENALLLAPAATHPLVTTNSQGQTRPTVFRVSYTARLQGEAAAHFAQTTLNMKRAALLINTGDDFSTILADSFARRFAAGGGIIVHRATFNAGTADFTNTLTAIRDSGAELLYLPTGAGDANRIAGRMAELGILGDSSGPALLGSDAWESDAFNLTTMAGSYYPAHFVPPAHPVWRESYKAIYAIQPHPLAALGYDAANLLARAIQLSNSLDPIAVSQTLEQLEFEGVTGPVTFNASHNPLKPVPFFQIRDDGILFLTAVTPPDSGGRP